MASIAAVVSWDEQHSAVDFVERMLDPVAHRGGQRCYAIRKRHIALASIGRDQAMPADADKLSQIKCDFVKCVGDLRLDDREELCHRLGCINSQESDANLLVKAYERWDDGFLEHVTGDFGFVLWDEQRRLLLAARDPFGVRPLYYAVLGSQIVFASEVKQILNLCGFAFPIENRAVLGILTGDFQPARETFFQKIRRVIPGHGLKVQNAKIVEFVYWSPPKSVVRYPCAADYFDEFRLRFRRSVERRLGKAEPIVAQLSGGLDSSSIVCMADSVFRSRNEAPTMQAISAVFPGLSCDESAFIDAVVRKVGIRSHRWDATSVCPFTDREETSVDHPWAGRSLSDSDEEFRLVEKIGAHVIVSGFGGDELLFERGIYRDLAASGKWGSLIQETMFVSMYSSQGGAYFLWDAVRSLLPASLRRLYRRLSPRRDSAPPTWLGEQLKKTWATNTEIPSVDSDHPFHSQTQRSTWEWLRNPKLWWALELQNLVAAQHGFEFRYPFLDRGLAEFVLALPFEMRRPMGEMKALLRKSLKSLMPPLILRRRRVTTFETVVVKQFMNCQAALRSIVYDQVWHSEPFVSQAYVQRLFDRIRQAPDANATQAIATIFDFAKLELWIRGLYSKGVFHLQGA